MSERNDSGENELHLRYLEASFEGFRKSSFSLIILNAGAILALTVSLVLFVCGAWISVESLSNQNLMGASS